MLWRFAGGGESVPKATLEARERRADCGISLMFVALAAIVIYDAAKDLVARDADRDLIELIVLYTPSTLLFFVLGAAKLHVGSCIRSPSLREEPGVRRNRVHFNMSWTAVAGSERDSLVCRP